MADGLRRRRLRPASLPGAAWLGVAAVLAAGAVLVTATMAATGSFAPEGAVARALDWQPRLTVAQPWRAWTAAWVHWSWAHLAVNLAGAAAVAWVGWRARVPLAGALAWCLAWPATQVLLDVATAWPQSSSMPGAGSPLEHYGGLSGVLHAGVVVLGLGLAFPGRVPLHATSDVDVDVGNGNGNGNGNSNSNGNGDGDGDGDGNRNGGSGNAAVPDSAAGRRNRLVGAALCAGTLAKVLHEAPWDLALRPSAFLGIGVAPVAHACGMAAGTAAWAVVVLATRGRLRTPAALR